MACCSTCAMSYSLQNHQKFVKAMDQKIFEEKQRNHWSCIKNSWKYCCSSKQHEWWENAFLIQIPNLLQSKKIRKIVEPQSPLSKTSAFLSSLPIFKVGHCFWRRIIIFYCLYDSPHYFHEKKNPESSFFTKIRNSHFVETCDEYLISYLDDCQMGYEVFIGWNWTL